MATLNNNGGHNKGKENNTSTYIYIVKTEPLKISEELWNEKLSYIFYEKSAEKIEIVIERKPLWGT